MPAYMIVTAKIHDRDAFLADPAQAEVPVARLTGRDYLSDLRALIRPDRALEHLPQPGEALLPPHRDTVYLCVVDRDGGVHPLEVPGERADSESSRAS